MNKKEKNGKLRKAGYGIIAMILVMVMFVQAMPMRLVSVAEKSENPEIGVIREYVQQNYIGFAEKFDTIVYNGISEGVEPDLVPVGEHFEDKKYTITYKDENGNTKYKKWGSQCWAYAKAAYNYLFEHDDADYKFGPKFSEATAKTSLSKSDFDKWGVRFGAFLRTTANKDGSYHSSYGHSLLILKYDDQHVWILDGNGDGKCGVAIRKYTWSEFNYTLFTRKGRCVHSLSQPSEKYYAKYICSHESFNNKGYCEGCGGDYLQTSAYAKSINYDVAGLYEVIDRTHGFATRPYGTYENKGKNGSNTPGVCVKVLYSVENHYKGHVWYYTEQGFYYSDYCKLYGKFDNTIDISIDDVSSPHEQGKTKRLTGTISSRYPIVAVRGYVKDLDTGKIVLDTGWSAEDGTSTSLEIRYTAANKNLPFGKLPNGRYKYCVQVRSTLQNGSNYEEAWSNEFTVASPVVKQPCPPPAIVNKEAIYGGYRITLRCSLPEASIFYTTDGTAPDARDSRGDPLGTYVDETISNEIYIYGTTRLRAVSEPYDTDTYYNGYFDETIIVPQAAEPQFDEKVTADGIQITILEDTAKYASTYYSINDGDYKWYDGMPITITEPCIITAYTQAKGATNSEIVRYEIKEINASVPVVSLAGAAVIPVGDTATFVWDNQKTASGYIVKLYKDGELIKTEETSKTAVTYQLDEIAAYSVTVEAVNSKYGNSGESDPVTVQTMAPVTVEFRDHDGAVLSSQTIDYGTDASSPSSPSRKGYDFLYWTDENGNYNSNIYKSVKNDIVLTAAYRVREYTVQFYDYDGTYISKAKVSYGGSAATPDDKVTIPSGYCFAGWSVFDSDNGCTNDYTNVDGSMSLRAIVCWENETLPVHASIISASADAEDVYTVEVGLKNWNSTLAGGNVKTNAYVCVSLKTQDGKLVYVDHQSVSMAPDNTVDEFTRTLTFEIPCSEKASVVEVEVLEKRSDSTTGSALSLAATGNVSNMTTWSEWSEWSETAPQDTSGRVIESKTQYRYQDKESLTSTSASVNGYTYSGTSWKEYGSWSGWKPYYIAASSTLDVKSDPYYKKLTEGYYETVYGRYASTDCSKCTSGGYSVYGHFCDICGKNYYGGTWYWDTVKLSYEVSQGSSAGSCSHKGGPFYRYKINGITYYHKTTRYVEPTYQTYYNSRSITTYYTHYRWLGWSEWSDTEYYADSTRNVETRTVYRYKEQVADSNLAAGESTNFVTCDVSGTLADIDLDLGGKVATIMVYREKNTDPIQTQMQYIGQTAIGDGNAYQFDIILEQMPTVETGNYVVALGIEGSTGLIKVDTIYAPDKQYKVSFKTMDGELISEQMVSEGDSAVLPEAPAIEGMKFVIWDNPGTYIMNDTTITAIYVPVSYAVVFVDWANQVVASLQAADYGANLVLPPTPAAEGRTFLGWKTSDGVSVDENTVVTGNMIIEADYEIASYEVRFHGQDGSIIDTQMVEYGGCAVLPEDLVVADRVFAGWNNNACWWNVTESIDVYPIIVFVETTAEPTANVVSDQIYSTSAYVELFAEENAVIYYTTDGSDPDEFSEIYTSPIMLEESANIKAFAVCEDKNISDIVEIVFEYSDDAYAAADEEIVNIDTKEVYVEPGDEITLNVDISENPGLAGYRFFVQCDRTVFSVDYDDETGFVYTPGEITERGSAYMGPYSDNGWQILWFDTAVIEGDGNLFSIVLNVSSEAEAGVYPITLSYSPVDTLTAEDVDGFVNEENFTIIAETEYVIGDANGDGNITLADVILISRHIVSLSQISSDNLKNADVNGDGKITNGDVILLARYIAGLEASLR